MTHDGVFYRVESGDASDFHNNLPAMKADINNMRVIHTGEQKWFKREDKWSIRECFGFTEVLVHGGKKEHKEVDKLKIKEEQYLIMPIPFIRVPDAHGILLALGDFNYEGTLELWDPYEGQGDIRENYPYAPVTYTTASGKEIQLDRKIATVNIGSNLPDFVIAWAASMGGYDPFITYKEVDNLYGGMYFPDYAWMDFDMPGEGYYGIDLASGGYMDWCEDDGNYGGWGWSQLTFNGAFIGERCYGAYTAIDYQITGSGSALQVISWTPASNMQDKWGVIVKKSFSSGGIFEYYPGGGEDFCDGLPTWLTNIPGTYAGSLVEADYFHELIYMDCYGSYTVLDTQTSKNASGFGFVKMHEFGGRTVFTFNFYNPTTGCKFAGLAENGNVTVTDISTLVDKDGNSYSQPMGQNHLGLVVFKYLKPHEKVITVY